MVRPPGKDQRWEGDARGKGIANAAGLGDAVEALLAAMREGGWVAEDAEGHLLPHLERAIEESRLDLRMQRAAVSSDGALEVDLTARSRADRPRAAVCQAVFELLGSIAEGSTHVHETAEMDGSLVFDVTTGMLDADTPFRGHGHTLRIRLRDPEDREPG